MKKLKLMLLIGLVALTMGLAGCADDGTNGVDGAPGADGADAVVQHTDESCLICHTTGKIADVAVAHPLLLEKPMVSDIVVSSVAGVGDSVTFNVFESDGTTGIAGLGDGDFRFYMADTLPAGVATTTTFVDTTDPVTTWETPMLARWMYERDSTSNQFGTLVDNGGGSYTYTFAVDLAAGGASTIDMVDPTETVIAAPDFDLAHTQRLLIRADTRDLGYDRTIGLLDFVIPADAADSTETGTTRNVIADAACTACHNDPLQEAAHGGGYQSVAACNICHTPIGNTYGDEMQHIEAWSASLFHKIHAGIDMAAFPTRINGGGYSNVTYPKNIKDCEVCHFDDTQDMADAWNTNPTAETCSTCHDVTFVGATATHSAGAQLNSACVTCHPAAGNGFGQSVVGAHTVLYNEAPDANGDDVSITPVFDTTITMTAPANGTHYVAGEAPVVTVTTTATGDYDSLDNTVDYTAANVYVYGPRAYAVPVLTPSSTTDADWDPAIAPADQGRDMRASAAAADAMVLTDATGFKYQLQAIPADLEPGTYMVQVAIGHTSSRVTGSRNYKIDGWQLITFQVGTATESLRVAGEGCANCHTEADWGTMYHRSYFGTDGCIACHDKSGNHANFIANRVHAIHAASATGDLLGNAYDGTREGHFVTYPQDITTCQGCHTDDDQYRTEPTLFSPACIGCHGDTTGAKDHMIHNGAVFEAH